MKACTLLSACLAVAASALPARALDVQEAPPPGANSAAGSPTLHVPRIALPPTLDQAVEGRLPPDMVGVSDFRQRDPGDGDPVSRPTTAHVGYDSAHLYVVFTCQEDPGSVRAKLTRREAFAGDDTVFVALDTFRDRRRAYLFFANPLGIQLDAINTDGQGDDATFDALWHSEGRLTADGFVVLMAIPFRSLRFTGAPDQTWGIALGRQIAGRNELAFWPRVTRRIASTGEQMATLSGLRRITPGRNLQAIPYAAVTGSRYLDEGQARYRRETLGRVGFDAKAVVKDAITIDVTANPDFSQVESDEPQVTVNQRYETFFPEKRPFFVENAGMFRLPVNLFFSRRIVDPRLGARVTGKLGGWTIAGLAIDDRAPGGSPPDEDAGRGDTARSAALRVQRDVGAKSTVGVFASDYEFGPESNRVVAADARFQLSPRLVFVGAAARTRTVRPDGTTAAGGLSVASLDYSSRSLGWQVTYTTRSPDLHTAMGYQPRLDFRAPLFTARYTWFARGGRVLSVTPRAGGYVMWNYAGSLTEWSLDPEVSVELPAATSLVVQHSAFYERYKGTDLGQRSTTFKASTSWFRWLTADVRYVVAVRPNYYPVAGASPFLGDGREWQLAIRLRPSSRLGLEGTWISNRLDAGGVSSGIPARGSVYRSTLARAQAVYQFGRTLSLRAIADWNGVEANPALILLERDRRLTGDVLLTWQLNPWTALYAGFNDRHANLAVAPGGSLQRTASPGLNTGRQFFVKVGYLLRY